MKNTIAKFIVLLSNTSFSPRELDEISRWLSAAPPRTLVRMVNDTRRIIEASLNHIEKEVIVPKNSLIDSDMDVLSGSSRSEKTASKNCKDTAIRIDSLLRKEAGLSTAQAAELISEGLLREIRPGSFPEYKSGSLQAWIVKLFQTVPPSLLLHVVARIRNELVHRPTRGWPLK